MILADAYNKSKVQGVICFQVASPFNDLKSIEKDSADAFLAPSVFQFGIRFGGRRDLGVCSRAGQS